MNVTQNDPRHPSDTQEIEKNTISHYDENANRFYEGTKDHDVSQNYDAFLTALKQEFGSQKKLDILDFGCGPGRDLNYFQSLGHRPVGLDGSQALCAIAKGLTDGPVLNQTFMNLSLSSGAFDGVFANASLFHVPKRGLPYVLESLHACLRKRGILFMSNPRGNQDGWSGRRYGNYMEFEVIAEYLAQAHFTVVDHYYRPEGLPRHQQPWLALLSQKS